MLRGLLVSTMLLVSVQVRADVALPPPGPQRVAQADLVLVGRVVALEDRDQEVAPAPKSTAKVVYRIALVAVTEPILGKTPKVVRVGFRPPVDPKVVGGAIFRRPEYTPQLTVGMDGLFYLSRHPVGDFHFTPMYYDIIRRTDPTFAQELSEAKQAAGLLADPLENLRQPDPENRFRTAALLLARYRIPVVGASRQEPIAAEESKLILEALRDARWQRPTANRGRTELDPWTAFNTLGLTERDGWSPPKGARSIQDYHAAAQDWLRRHAASFRIRRFVREGS